jgi:chemotaxis protein methyltransferase CheR
LGLDEQGFQWFKQMVFSKTGIDLNSYKEKQMKRRIDALINRVGLFTYEEYFHLLVKDQVRYAEFLDRLTINVSEFFRNTNRWDVLRDRIIPKLRNGRRMLKCWSAACSTGEEAYSLAMTLSELGCLAQSSVLATDIDATALLKAQTGEYTSKATAVIPHPLRERYFHHNDQSSIVVDQLRKGVQFRHHDLLTESYPSDLDLIICRNVMIYFTEEAKANVYRKFNQSLRPGGVLFVGGTEQIFNAKEIGFSAVDSFFYEKIV